MRLSLILIAIFSLARVATAAKIEPVFNSANQWTPLVITIDTPPAGGTLWLRDARGGVAIGRAVSPGDKTILMSLPQLSPQAKWEIKLWIEPAQTEASAELITLERGMRNEKVSRIISSQPVNDADPNSEIAALPDREILAAPPMSLAGVDVIVLTPSLRDALTPQRALALRTVGIKLLYAGPGAPIGPLAKLQWEQAKPGLQISPLESLRPPQIIEELLPRIPAPQPQVNSAAKTFAMILIPAVIALVVLARFLSAHPFIATLIFAGTIIAGSIIMLWTLSATAAPKAEELTWSTLAGNSSLTEKLELYNSQMPADLDLHSADAVALLPVTTTESGWLKETSDRLLLAEKAEKSTFTGKLTPYQPRAFLSRSAQFTTATTAGVLVKNGYVQIPDSPPIELTAWIGSLPESQKRAANAWYQLRFFGTQNYTLSSQPTSLLITESPPSLDTRPSTGHLTP